MFLLKKPRKRVLLLSLVLIFILGILLGTYAGGVADRKFENYTKQLFTKQLAENTLNLHYTLADPKLHGLDDYKSTLGSAVAPDPDAYFSSLENARTLLLSFPYQSLSRENQLTYDILKLYYDTELSSDNQYILTELLSPSLGIQAQLPLLLAEYTFRTKKDIQDYLHLLKDMPSYFDDIIAFEKEKSGQGCFMSDTTADRIISQCSSFIASGDSNYLNTVFEEKIETSSFLTDQEKSACIKLHQKLVSQSVIPAYEHLIAALTKLKGTGQNHNGLYYLPEGKAYYTYLIKSSCGIYDSVEELQTRLANQLMADYKEIHTLLSKNPSLPTALFSEDSMNSLSPQQMISSLQQKIQNDFPQIPSVSYEIKYVHDDLKEHLSPAFYLTPPIDTGSPNLIYLNPDSNLSGIELYTTLAHEGFPGHLYQTQFFMNEDTNLMRHMVNMGGYVEGWATYTESYAYEYGSSEKNLGRALWLNRSMNLCLYALLDIGIHYYGWSLEEVSRYLANFGIKDGEICGEIYQCIVEDPANYLKYYGGCLKFMDLREAASKEENFELIDFHRKILTTGPCQFPVLEEYVLEK